MKKQFYVYILASKKNGTLYIGVTSNMIKRAYEHKTGVVEGFTKRYGVKRLVYFEVCDGSLVAIEREKQIKTFRRDWKIDLITKDNPDWNDLYESLL